MKNTYCDSKNCIHRRGCGRWIDFQQGNYNAKFEFFVRDEICVKKGFKHLIRVKKSDGSEL